MSSTHTLSEDEKKTQAKAAQDRYRAKHGDRIRERERKRRTTDDYRKKHAAHERTRRRKDKSIARRSMLKSKYGLTIEQYDEMLAAQENKCAICRSATSHYHGFCVDHCHSTGKVRGLLCHHCNLMLGYSRDNQSTLAAGIAYLKGHHGAN